MSGRKIGGPLSNPKRPHISAVQAEGILAQVANARIATAVHHLDQVIEANAHVHEIPADVRAPCAVAVAKRLCELARELRAILLETT